MAGNKVSVYRVEHFNAAHRLHYPGWDAAKNAEVFGLCNNPNYHGHNYELILKITGVPDPITGYVIDLKQVSDIVKKEIIERFDHRNLNLDCPEFRDVNPSAENIAVVIYNILRPLFPEKFDLKIRLHETKRNFVEYPADH
jgi:6-pyruvoyltetrahydropterin/6-carboxytetrahydropterin synthase